MPAPAGGRRHRPRCSRTRVLRRRRRARARSSRPPEKVASLGPGEHFGERGLLDNAPRNATVTTATDSTILRLEGSALIEALQSAATLLNALDRSNGSRRGLHSPAEHTALVDDPTWVEDAMIRADNEHRCVADRHASTHVGSSTRAVCSAGDAIMRRGPVRAFERIQQCRGGLQRLDQRVLLQPEDRAVGFGGDTCVPRCVVKQAALPLSARPVRGGPPFPRRDGRARALRHTV